MKKFGQLVLVLVSLGLSNLSWAQRVVEVSDGAVVRVSATEPNLVEAANGRISAFVFAEGKFTETIDTQAGVVYFHPLADGPRSGFVEVIDAHGERERYSLILVPDEQWPAQRIVLKAADKEPPPAQILHQPTSTSHVAAVKHILRQMLLGEARARQISETPVRTQLGELTLTRLATYPSNGLRGELHRLENTSTNLVVINEQQLHFANDVIAVVTPLRELKGQAATEVYLVRSGPEN